MIDFSKVDRILNERKASESRRGIGSHAVRYYSKKALMATIKRTPPEYHRFLKGQKIADKWAPEIAHYLGVDNPAELIRNEQANTANQVNKRKYLYEAPFDGMNDSETTPGVSNIYTCYENIKTAIRKSTFSEEDKTRLLLLVSDLEERKNGN